MLYHLRHPNFPNIEFKAAWADFMVLTEGPDHFEDIAAVPPALPLASPMCGATANTEHMARTSTTSKSNLTFHIHLGLGTTQCAMEILVGLR